MKNYPIRINVKQESIVQTESTRQPVSATFSWIMAYIVRSTFMCVVLKNLMVLFGYELPDNTMSPWVLAMSLWVIEMYDSISNSDRISGPSRCYLKNVEQFFLYEDQILEALDEICSDPSSNGKICYDYDRELKNEIVTGIWFSHVPRSFYGKGRNGFSIDGSSGFSQYSKYSRKIYYDSATKTLSLYDGDGDSPCGRYVITSTMDGYIQFQKDWKEIKNTLGELMTEYVGEKGGGEEGKGVHKSDNGWVLIHGDPPK